MENKLGAPPIVDSAAPSMRRLDGLARLGRKLTLEREGGRPLPPARRRLPMVEVPASTPLMGERGPRSHCWTRLRTPPTHCLLLHVVYRQARAWRQCEGLHLGHIAGSRDLIYS